MKRRILALLAEVASAILPVVTVVLLLHAFATPLDGEHLARFLGGAAMMSLGLMFFFTGVRLGFLPMGEIVGNDLPRIASVTIIIAMAFALGAMMALAEPTVRVLAHQVGLASDGLVGRNTLIFTIAVGVGVCVSAGVIRIFLGFPISRLLAGGYILALALASFTSAEFVGLAFDSGGVATGPITVPFVMALGLGIAGVLGGKSSFSDGFGLVGLACLGPILGVLLLGVLA
ncbi:Protein of unknown function (DUF1538) [Desulfocurvibacter africanus PCS]|uniref:DUF1538 domain-containing protein n=1 Tax=Desulfocurvibacter africanus PCS TaxID=1262666 RepID=M5PV52_DESAF|nr:DUF1538 domain-containing protein [Desulfocurvibacter africanus]EMG38217.1 Protein of unknown function (DUF1538) [Desulfocurvibacter africanus PCS]